MDSNDNNDNGNYQLRTELVGHQEDVRCVTTSGNDIITGSRDKTIRVWKEGDQGFVDDTVLVGHTDFVSAVATVGSERLPQYPEVSIVSGSRDASTILWDVEKGNPVATLTGHRYQISSVAVGLNGKIISASHDGTVRIYSGDSLENVVELSDHGGPVQCILVLDDSQFLTGSNDNTIKHWVQTTCQRTYEGHTDTVRSLALLPGRGVVSGSHDMTLKLWDFQGNIVTEFIGHTAIIFSVCASASGLIVSGSEDNTARVWQADGQCLATVKHPGCVWDVAFLPNLDWVTACADSIARVWTNESARAAPEETQIALQQLIAARSEPAQGAASSQATACNLPSGINLNDPSALQQPGRTDGEVKVINENGTGMAYAWNFNLQSWEKIGEVTGGVGGDMQAGRSGTAAEGESYDHVLNVDVDDNLHPLPLGINNNESPYVAADRFIERFGVPMSFREQIVRFIIENPNIRLPPGFYNNTDPFTGRLADAQAPIRDEENGHDDGASQRCRYPHRAVPISHIPATTMILMDSPINQAQVGQKVREFSGRMSGDLALTSTELIPHSILDQLLASTVPATRVGRNPSLEELALLKKLLHWPQEMLFPGFDIARLVAFSEHGSTSLSMNTGSLNAQARGTLGPAIARALGDRSEGGGSPNRSSQLTCMRFLCNCFRLPPLRSWVVSNAEGLLQLCQQVVVSPRRPSRAAVAAFLLNLAITHQREAMPRPVLRQFYNVASALLPSLEPSDDDAIYRLILAVGTMLGYPDGRVTFEEAINQAPWDQAIEEWARLCTHVRSDLKINAAAAELRQLLHGFSTPDNPE